ELSNPVFQKNALAIVAAGIVGAFVAGFASDKLFSHRRTPVAFIGYLLQIVCLAVVWKAPGLSAIIAAFIVNSLAISMVHSMLSGTASMDFGGQRAAATAAGMFDGMQYVGGSFVGFGMGWLLDHYGWSVWGPSMIGFAAGGAVLMLVLWNARPRTAAASSPETAQRLAGGEVAATPPGALLMATGPETISGTTTDASSDVRRRSDLGRK